MTMDFAWIEVGDGRSVFRKVDTSPPPKRSHLSAPMLIRDDMPPVKSMADGKIYTSKSAIRAGYKAGGFIEVGDDPARLRPKVKTDPKGIDESVERAVARFKRGEKPKV